MIIRVYERGYGDGELRYTRSYEQTYDSVREAAIHIKPVFPNETIVRRCEDRWVVTLTSPGLTIDTAFTVINPTDEQLDLLADILTGDLQ